GEEVRAEAPPRGGRPEEVREPVGRERLAADPEVAVTDHVGDEHGAGKPPRAPELRGHPARAVETVGRGPRLARLLAVEPHDPVRELVRPRRERARELDQEGRARATVVRPDEADLAEPLGVVVTAA